MLEHDRRVMFGEGLVKQWSSFEINGLRSTGGWIFVSFGIWAFLIGVIILSGNEKGRRSG